MNKLILLLLAGFIAYGMIRSYLRRNGRSDVDDVASKTKLAGENMVRCKHCGVHLPISESMLSQGNYFCSNEHRLMHSK
ncbi:MAG: PP0621 family protein [Burkholderiales bacterium]